MVKQTGRTPRTTMGAGVRSNLLLRVGRGYTPIPAPLFLRTGTALYGIAAALVLIDRAIRVIAFRR